MSPKRKTIYMSDCSFTSWRLLIFNQDYLSSVSVRLTSPPQPFFQCLHHRAVSPGTPLPPMEPWLKAALERPEVISERCQAPLEEMKRKFPLTEVEKKKKLKTSAQIFGKE